MTVFLEFRAFIDSVRRQQIRITEVLEQLANDPAVRQQTRDLVKQPGTFDGAIPDWLRTLMLDAGLSEEEVQHAESWPAAQKEVARLELSSAYEEDRPVHFSWDLNRGSRRFTRIRESESGETTIVFSDPRRRLKVGANDTVFVEEDGPPRD